MQALLAAPSTQVRLTSGWHAGAKTQQQQSAVDLEPDTKATPRYRRRLSCRTTHATSHCIAFSRLATHSASAPDISNAAVKAARPRRRTRTAGQSSTPATHDIQENAEALLQHALGKHEEAIGWRPGSHSETTQGASHLASKNTRREEEDC